MKKIRFVISGMAVVAALSAGCAFEQHSDVLAPSLPSGGSSAPSYIGTWISQATDLPSFASCSVLEWEITAQSSNSLSGTFSATCSGVLVEGRASGQLNGKSVPLSVAGTASLPGNPSCSFSLSGTGTIDGNTLTIPYSGTTCLGPVRGTEVLQKRTPPPPPAPPPPPPPAAPAAPPDPLLGCGPLASGDKVALITCIQERLNPPHTVEGAFDVTKRVAWALRGEGAGLLIKNAGENIVSWQGYSFSAARICYPDGHIFKALSDVPATNGPEWLDNGFVDRRLYVAAMDPSR